QSRKRHGDSDPRALRAAGNYAESLHALGRLDDASDICRPALDRARALPHGAGADAVTLHLINTFAGVLGDQGHSDQAELLLREAVARSRAALGDDHPTTIAALNNHA